MYLVALFVLLAAHSATALNLESTLDAKRRLLNGIKPNPIDAFRKSSPHELANVLELTPSLEHQSIQRLLTPRRHLQQQCAAVAPGPVGNEIDPDRSEIVEKRAKIVLDFPSYCYNVTIDIFESKENGIEHSLGYSSDTPNGWALDEAEQPTCEQSLEKSFSYSDLKNVGLKVNDDNIAEFWFDFFWDEDVSDDFFGNFTRRREVDVPFKLHLPESYSVPVTFNPDLSLQFRPSSSPSNQPSSSPSTGPSTSPSSGPTTSSSTTPSSSPSTKPSTTPSDEPTLEPSEGIPTFEPTTEPTRCPSQGPSNAPTKTRPSLSPSFVPSTSPSESPSKSPTLFPTDEPSVVPSVSPSDFPSTSPSDFPSKSPTLFPTDEPSLEPTERLPTLEPTCEPTEAAPTFEPTSEPTRCPSELPSFSPTTPQPSATPTSSSPSSSPTTTQPTTSPTSSPSEEPTFEPTEAQPTYEPTSEPTRCPSTGPSVSPSFVPSVSPSTSLPTTVPSVAPSFSPTTSTPSSSPTTSTPTTSPSPAPTDDPTIEPSEPFPTLEPTMEPTQKLPTFEPTSEPTNCPSDSPSVSPSFAPSTPPSTSPSKAPTPPTFAPTDEPTCEPSTAPSFSPSESPSVSPSFVPSTSPSNVPSKAPTTPPSTSPTDEPTLEPSEGVPTFEPTSEPTRLPTDAPSFNPSIAPSAYPTKLPTAGQPSTIPSSSPTYSPTISTPTSSPSSSPSVAPSKFPSGAPTDEPTFEPSEAAPTFEPTSEPTRCPSDGPSSSPSSVPSSQPTGTPSSTPSSSPSSQPSSIPTLEPSMMPTVNLTAMYVIRSTAVENIKGDTPWIEIELTTAANWEWTLVADYLSGSEADYSSTINFTQIGYDWDCNQPGSVIDGWLCQTWLVKFYTSTQCVRGNRNIVVHFDATVGGHSKDLPVTLTVGGSAAFACAKDLGTFELTEEVRYKTEDSDWENQPPTMFLEEKSYFEVGLHSGANITDISITSMSIYASVVGEEKNYICEEDCLGSGYYSLEDAADDQSDNFVYHTFSYTFTGRTGQGFMQGPEYAMELTYDVTYLSGNYETRRMLLEVDPRRGLAMPERVPFSFPISVHFVDPIRDGIDTIVDEIKDEIIVEPEDYIEYEVRFNYDCAMVEAAEEEEKFLEECSRLMFPTQCRSLRCGSIIVKMASPTVVDRDAMVRTLAYTGMTLPSFGEATVLELEPEIEQEVQSESTTHAASSALIYGSIALIVISVAACIMAHRKRQQNFTALE